LSRVKQLRPEHQQSCIELKSWLKISVIIRYMNNQLPEPSVCVSSHEGRWLCLGWNKEAEI